MSSAMIKRFALPSAILLALLLAIGLTGCDSSNPVAPSGSTLTLIANPTQISLGESSVITLTGFRPDGNPLNPGSQINLSTDLGVLGSNTVEIDDNGRAQTTLTPDGRPGAATITASLPAGEATTTVTVQIGEDGVQPTLEVTATPSRINIEQESTINVVARNVDGSLLSGGRVRLRTNLGQLDDQSVITDANGEAATLLRPDGRSGSADVSGSVDAGTEVMTQVTFLQTQLVLEANPNIVPVLGPAELTVLVRDEDFVPLREGHRVRLTANLGTVDPQFVTTDANGEALVTYIAGDRAGQDEIQAFLENTTGQAMAQISIRDAPAFIDLFPTQRTVASEGGTIEMRAQVQNAQGEPLAGILVIFNSPDVGGIFSNTETVTTNTAGEATNVLSLTVNDLDALPPGQDTFIIRATARGEGAEVIDEQTIRVLN